MSRDPNISVASAFDDGGWHIHLRRALGHSDIPDWEDLHRQTAGFLLSVGPDELMWTLEPSGKFSVRSLYRKLCQGVPRKHYSEIWGIAVPLKVRIFLWQLVRKRLPSGDNLTRRNGPSNGLCEMCGQVEDIG